MRDGRDKRSTSNEILNNNNNDNYNNNDDKHVFFQIQFFLLF